MKKGIQILSMIFTASLFLSISAIANESSSVAYDDLVEYWAPTIYQDVTTEYDVRADFITRFDFDGDWSGSTIGRTLFCIRLHRLYITPCRKRKPIIL